MQIQPNKTIIEAKVKRIDLAADGWGANVLIAVIRSEATEDEPSFLQTEPGAELTVFVPQPETIQAGHDYRLTARVLGGPGGERIVIQDALES